MVTVNLTRREIKNIVHLLDYDNEQWERMAPDPITDKYLCLNDKCLKKLRRLI